MGSNIELEVRRYNGVDWDKLFPITIAANVIYGNTNVGAKLGDIDSSITSLNGHVARTDNPHGVTKAQVELGNVENKSTATIKSEFTGAVASGNTGFVTGDAVNTAISSAIASTYVAKGSVTFNNLPSLASASVGWVYDVSDSFTTTSDFVEGAGHTYPAGTNVVCISVSSSKKWDVLTGMVDLSGYVQTSRKINNKALTSDITLGAEDIVDTAHDSKSVSYWIGDLSDAISSLGTNKQDKITAERGLSFGTGSNANKLGHSNSSVTAVTTESFKKIKYDTYGHITGSSNVTKSDILALDISDIRVGYNTPQNPTTDTIWLYYDNAH